MALETLRKFVNAWVHPEYHPTPVSKEALDRVEARFETYLPLAYRECMSQIGPPSPGMSLLSTIVERRLDIPEVGEFFDAEGMIENTEGWREIGLPENMVAFASTGGGDFYCFEVVPETSQVPEDATVWYFDHEEREIESLELPFTQWLALYANIPNPPAWADA
jgi:SMI1-KNR4 cell-wall